MSKPKLVKNENGNYFIPFLNEKNEIKLDKNGQERGYLKIIEEDFRTIGRGVIDKDKYCTVSGTRKTLSKIIDSAIDGKGHLEGRIVTQECTEEEIMEEGNYLRSAFLGKEDYIAERGFEKMIEPYIKRIAKDSPALRFEGAKILTFKSYDPTGQMQDVLVKHDNYEEIAEWKLANKRQSITPNTNFDDTTGEETANVVKNNKVTKKLN